MEGQAAFRHSAQQAFVETFDLPQGVGSARAPQLGFVKLLTQLARVAAPSGPALERRTQNSVPIVSCLQEVLVRDAQRYGTEIPSPAPPSNALGKFGKQETRL